MRGHRMMGCVVATTVLDTAQTDAKITGYIHPRYHHSEYRKPLLPVCCRDCRRFLIPGSLRQNARMAASITRRLSRGERVGWQSHNLFYTLLFRRQGCSRQFLRSFYVRTGESGCVDKTLIIFLCDYFRCGWRVRLLICCPVSAPGYLQRIPDLRLTLSAQKYKKILFYRHSAWQNVTNDPNLTPCHPWRKTGALPAVMVKCYPYPIGPPHPTAWPYQEDNHAW